MSFHLPQIFHPCARHSLYAGRFSDLRDAVLIHLGYKCCWMNCAEELQKIKSTSATARKENPNEVRINNAGFH